MTDRQSKMSNKTDGGGAGGAPLTTSRNQNNQSQISQQSLINPTAQFLNEEGNVSENNVNGRLKNELSILIERLEGALGKFKERKEKMRQPQSITGLDGD